ncbi:hypothetical protein [Aliiglaciecola lipolytica]|nr:hypothetical protein [Aliiglaciecola lipolytica]
MRDRTKFFYQTLKYASLMTATGLLLGCSQSTSTTNNKGMQQANVTIDAGNIIGQQSPLYYGGNNIYPKGGQGLLNSDQQFDKTTIQLATDLGLRAYRFPGGSEGNLYKWKRGIGPLEQRIDNISGNNQGPQSNEFGSDEFGRLLETTNFDQGFMMVAYGYEKPDDAADWVEYMNSPVGENPNGGIDWAQVRADNGHPEPYGIKYWEIGNEVYGNWELNWGSYPTKYDAKRGTGNVAVDTVSAKAGTLPFGDAHRYIHGGYKYFEQQKAASQSSWKDAHIKTSGQPSQQLYVKFAPVDLSEESYPFELTIADIKWQKVADFSKSSPTDKHYTLDTESGMITFGDGQRGAIPPKQQFVMLNYRSGRQPGFIEYYQKMKAVDPDIIVLSCFEKESFYRGMAEVNAPFDGVVKHYYPSTFKNVPKELAYEAQIARGLGIERTIKEHQHWIKEHQNSAISGDEKLWFTEYGLRGHVNQVATMHTVIGQYSQTVGALLGHSLFLNNNTPMINDNGVVRSRALPVPLFSKHSEQLVVKSNVQAPTMQVDGSDFPALLSTATVNEQGDKLSLILTNTQAQKAISVDLKVENMAVDEDSSAEIWILKSNTGNPVDDNREGAVDNITLSKMTSIPVSLPLSVEVPKAATIVVKLKAKS